MLSAKKISGCPVYTFQTLLKRKIKFDIIHLGDVFDRRKYISFTSLRAAKEMFFQPTWEHRLNVHMLVGNHDSVYRNTLELNSVNLLCKEYPNIIEYCSPETLTLSDGTPILMVPWICKDNEGELLEEMAITPAQIVMGHLELSGFQMNKGFVVQEGFDHKMFSAFDMVCTGHYHCRSTKGNITYLGNTCQLYWNDFGHDRGFHILNTNTKKLTFVKNPYVTFNKIYYKDDIKLSPVQLRKLEGTYVKLIVEQKEDQVKFDQTVRRLQQADLADLKIIEDTSYELDDVTDVEVEDTLTILETCVKDFDNKDNIFNILKSLYMEALEV